VLKHKNELSLVDFSYLHISVYITTEIKSFKTYRHVAYTVYM